MTSMQFSMVFIIFLSAMIVCHFWLAIRQIRHVMMNRAAVPVAFADKISLANHQKAADYTLAKTRFNLMATLFSAIVLLSFTLLGGLQALSQGLYQRIGEGGMPYKLGLLGAFFLISNLLDFPWSYIAQFRLEKRFGFNRMTRALFVSDSVKSLLLNLFLGLPLATSLLWLMEKAGSSWWAYCWVLISSFLCLMMVIYPTLIAPLFNRFSPMTDLAIKTRIEALIQRVGFTAKGIFVMDGSKRSTHGNAYFSGFGINKRIVFFDTLLTRLSAPEIEAVLAHELGHFKLNHVTKRLLMMLVASFLFFALLGYLADKAWFFTGLGVTPLLLTSTGSVADGTHHAMALILFLLVSPVFSFFLTPLLAILSRKQEFEADAFAIQHTHATNLSHALVKLYQDNATTLTPDPLYSAFFDSHPPATLRIAHMMQCHHEAKHHTTPLF